MSGPEMSLIISPVDFLQTFISQTEICKFLSLIKKSQSQCVRSSNVTCLVSSCQSQTTDRLSLPFILFQAASPKQRTA